MATRSCAYFRAATAVTNDVLVVLMRFPSAPLPPVFAPQFLLPSSLLI